MSSLLQVSAECERYFIDHWSQTPLQLPDTEFRYKGISTWISIDTNPVDNSIIGMNGTTTGREKLTALTSLFAYHTNKKLAIKLADDIKNFFTGVSLPLDIQVNYAQYHPPTLLDNGFWEVKVNFEVIQFS